MFVLASASPRRKELLKKIISDFIVCPSDISEDIPTNIKAADVAEHLATKKALDISKHYPNDIVIGCDTIIVYNDKIYGKAKDKNDAFNMLKTFSGKTHSVITGVCIISKNKSISFSSINEVTFYDLSDKEIENYLQSEEYIDKAGAYAIQGKAGLFVKKIHGDYNSIVGLPVSKLNRVLKIF